MSDKLVCVCVPCYNSAPTLAETLESILAQTYRNLRVIVVDNASKDATAEIARGFARRDPRLRVESYAKDVSYTENWSRGLQLAEGDYTCLFHADDLYEPRMIEREVEMLESHPEAGIVFTGARYIDQDRRELGAFRPPEEVFSRFGGVLMYADVLRVYLKYGELFMTPSAMARTPIYRDELREFSPRFGYASDIDAWLRIAEKHPVAFVADPLMRYRRSLNSGGFVQFRTRTKLSDGFLALEPRTRAAVNAGLLSDADLDYLEYAIFKDKIRCAVVGVIKGDRPAARKMAADALSARSFRLCASSFGRLVVLAIGWSCWLAAFVPLPSAARALLFKLRFDYFRPYA